MSLATSHYATVKLKAVCFITILSWTLKAASTFIIAFTVCEKKCKIMVMRFQSPLVYKISKLGHKEHFGGQMFGSAIFFVCFVLFIPASVVYMICHVIIIIKLCVMS